MANYDAGSTLISVLGVEGVPLPASGVDRDAGATLNSLLGAKGVPVPASGDDYDVGVSSVGVLGVGGVGFWVPFPYEGSRWLKVENGGTPNPFEKQDVLIPGLEYRFIGFGLSDGYALPRLEHDGSPLWTGDPLTVWQLIDVTFTATAFDLSFVAASSSTGQWVGFDYCVCETTLPLVDPATYTAEIVEEMPLGFNAAELGRIMQEATLGGVKSYLIVNPIGAFRFDTPGFGYDQGLYGGAIS